MSRVTTAIAVLLAAAVTATAASAEPAPAAADLLFETPQWGSAAPGRRLVYRYRRATGLEAVFGPPVDDRLALTLAAGDAPDRRTVKVDMFSGREHRAAGPFEDVSTNPALLLFLEHHLQLLQRVLSANPRYLKNGIRAGLRDRAVVTPASIETGGRMVPGWRVTVRPFMDDPNKVRMRGLESLTYTFLTSDDVPGTIASIEARATSVDGGTLLEESLTHDPSAD